MSEQGMRSHARLVALLCLVALLPVAQRATASSGPPPRTSDLAGRPLPQPGTWERLMQPLERLPVRLPEDPLALASTNGTSLGTVTQGRLKNGRHLPPVGPGYAVLGEHRQRKGLHWGTAELVRLVQDAGLHLAARDPGTVLGVGNLSLPLGGDSPYSVSHNSGRDVDLSFLLIQGPEGRPYVPTRFHHLQPDGRVRGQPAQGLRLDPAKTWALVEVVLTHPLVQVQWLFVADPIKEQLLTYARQAGVEEELIRRAEQVLHQPSEAAPHDDHFHLRIYCAPDDLLDGCRDFGPVWPWVDRYEDIVAARIDQLVTLLLGERDLPRRLTAVDRLEQLGAQRDVARLLPLLEAPEAALRARIAQAVGRLGSGEQVAVLLTRLEQEPEQGVRLELIRALGRLREAAAVEALVRLLPAAVEPGPPGRVTRTADPLSPAALEALVAIGQPQAVPHLIRALTVSSPSLRRQLAAALGQLTSQQLGTPAWWGATRNRVRLREGQARWQDWWAKHVQQPRAAWLREGFAAAGYPLRVPVEPEQLPLLLRARRSGPPHIRYQAELLLRQLAELDPPGPGEQLRSLEYWQSWSRQRARQHRTAG